MATYDAENLVIEKFDRTYAPEMCYNRVVAWAKREDDSGYDIGYSELAESPRLEFYVEDPLAYKFATEHWGVSSGIRYFLRNVAPGDIIQLKFMVKGYDETLQPSIFVIAIPSAGSVVTLGAVPVEQTWTEITTSEYEVPAGASYVAIQFDVYGVITDVSIDRVKLYVDGTLTRFEDDYFQSGTWGHWERVRVTYVGGYSKCCPTISRDAYEGTYAVRIYPSYEMFLEAYAAKYLTNMRRGWLRYQMDIRGIDLQLFDKVDISYLLRTLNLTGDASVMRISDASYDINSTGSKTSLTLVNAAYEVVSERLRRGMGSPSLSDLILATSGK